uniref:Uncharacterized protein n=1 Tax=Fusarium oxysporum (strain Fo5176) TaxID=660025 RepID=A0A0D2XKN9_FUSOF
MFLPKNIYEALKMAQKVNDPVEKRNELFLETELMTAVENNHRPKVQRLLEQGAHIHAQDCFGKTAMHHAAQLGHFDIINILLDYGASMKVIDSHGKTPMDYITYTKPKDWENVEEIAYKMQKTPAKENLFLFRRLFGLGDRCGLMQFVSIRAIRRSDLIMVL